MKTIAKKPSASANADVIALLNQSLADMMALKINAKLAHWNVKGANFLTLHELFDRVATESDNWADMIAERAVQLGGIAEGSIAHVAKRAANANATPVTDAQKNVRAVAAQLSATAERLRDAIDTADELEDKVTADMYTQITSGLDKLHWFVSSHQS